MLPLSLGVAPLLWVHGCKEFLLAVHELLRPFVRIVSIQKMALMLGYTFFKLILVEEFICFQQETTSTESAYLIGCKLAYGGIVIKVFPYDFLPAAVEGGSTNLSIALVRCTKDLDNARTFCCGVR